MARGCFSNYYSRARRGLNVQRGVDAIFDVKRLALDNRMSSPPKSFALQAFYAKAIICHGSRSFLGLSLPCSRGIIFRPFGTIARTFTSFILSCIVTAGFHCFLQAGSHTVMIINKDIP